MPISSPQFRDRAFGVAAHESTYDDWLRFERLIAELSARFIHIADDQIESEVGESLGLLGRFLDVDRINLVEARVETLCVLQSWAGPGSNPLPKSFPAALLPWYVATLQRGEIVKLNDISDFPESAARDRQTWTELGSKSHLGIPLQIGQSVVGALTFSAIHENREWPDDLVQRLCFVGEIFANALSRKRASERHALQQRELAHVARVAAMGELTAVIAHELHQPLTSILANAGAARLLLENPRGGRAVISEALTDITADATRAAEIIRRLRSLMRKDEGAKSPIDINDLLAHAEPILKMLLREFDVPAKWELARNLPSIQGDSVELQQVILNLVGNACHAMQYQPQAQRMLCIQTVQEPEGQVVVRIIDNGPPVSDDVIDQMFEPFFTTRDGGLGMGLSISRSIAANHHGRLWATRNAGNGLTVHLMLPAIV